MSVRLHEQHASVSPFGAAGRGTDFTPGRVSIEMLDGRVVAERKDPRASFSQCVDRSASLRTKSATPDGGRPVTCCTPSALRSYRFSA
jgi:hypothetical protein